jgi:hypothetical protein
MASEQTLQVHIVLNSLFLPFVVIQGGHKSLLSNKNFMQTRRHEVCVSSERAPVRISLNAGQMITFVSQRTRACVFGLRACKRASSVAMKPQEKTRFAAEWSRNKLGFTAVHCSSELKKEDYKWRLRIYVRHFRQTLVDSFAPFFYNTKCFCQTYIDVLDCGLSRCFVSIRLRVCVSSIVGYF